MKKKDQTEGMKEKLNQIAAAAAHIVKGAAFEKHRGQTYAGDGVYVLFGNDGYSGDERPQAEARAALNCAVALKLETSDIQTDEMEHYSWALAVKSDKDDAAFLYAEMCDEWRAANERWKEARDQQNA